MINYWIVFNDGYFGHNYPKYTTCQLCYEWYHESVGEIIGIEKSFVNNPEVMTDGITPDCLGVMDVEVPVASDDQLLGSQVRYIAQELHTAVYLKMGYITELDLNEDGVFLDKYTSQSTYVVSMGKTRISACRYISATEKDGIMSLPTSENFSIDLSVLASVARADDWSDILPDEVVEVSGLVSVPLDPRVDTGRDEYDATQLMYAAVLRKSLERGHKLWILNTNPRLLRAFSALVGAEQVHVLGTPQQYMNITTIPAAMNPQSVIEGVMYDQSPYGPVKRAHIVRALHGMDASEISRDMQLLLMQHGVQFGLSKNA